MRHIEDAAQAEVIRWARMRQAAAPELELLYHVPNGGKRGKLEACRLKAQGVRAGVPDLHLPIARGGYIGLWIEMKTSTGRLSEAQRKIIAMLRDEGHRVEVCRSAADAVEVLEDYMRVPAPHPSEPQTQPVHRAEGHGGTAMLGGTLTFAFPSPTTKQER